MIKKILIGCASVALLGLGGVAALVVYALVANGAADRAAAAFCKGTPVGSEFSQAVARAEREKIRQLPLEGGKQSDFLFQGGIFYASACRIDVDQGKVAAVATHVYDD